MKINVKNAEKVNATLDAVQCRAKVRLSSARDVSAAIEQIEARLKTLKVPKKEWLGIKVLDQRLERFAGAYKWRPDATLFTVERFKTGWFLTGARRDGCEGNPDESLYFGNEPAYQHLYKF
jgi:hypothetical protein